MHQLLSEDQRDALQEINNIAMGQAGRSLADALGAFIHLSIPKIKVVKADVLNQSLADTVGEDHMVAVVRQSFSGPLRGETLVIFEGTDYAALAELLGFDGTITPAVEDELLTDLSNILSGSFHSGLSSVLELNIAVSPPTLMAKQVPVGELIKQEQLSWDHLIMIGILFEISEKGFKCYLAQLMPDHALAKLTETIDNFIASMA